jgi:murein DD-endopeptidase MepM/ murein hydrolase activator NlpD
MRVFIVMLFVLGLVLLAITPLLPLDLVSPLETYEPSSGFGPRLFSMGGYVSIFHPGVDLRAPPGTRVRAAAEGRVIQVWLIGWYGGVYHPGHPVFGRFVVIEHIDTSVTRYGHLSEILTHEGEYVIAGRTIGIIGNSGISTGTHLHYEHLRAPVIPPSVEPESAERAYWRRQLAGFMAAEQDRLGDE